MSLQDVPVAGIVLAAGEGRRMGGRVKQLLPLDGLPLLSHAVRAAEASTLSSVIVVVGYQASAIRQALGPMQRARLVENPRYAEGQSTSLQAGLAALDVGTRAAVIMLGDQPRVRPEVIDAIVDAYRRALQPDDDVRPAGGGSQVDGSTTAKEAPPLVIVPTYGGRDGHPILLDRALWPAVMAIRGDEGARSVIRAHAQATLRLPVTAAGTPPDDVDTPQDYIALSSDG